MLSKLPEPLRKKVMEAIMDLNDTILSRRLPRILVIGRRGAGKSSLINAIFREPVASTGSVKSQLERLNGILTRVLMGSSNFSNTRGLGDRTKPESR